MQCAELTAGNQPVASAKRKKEPKAKKVVTAAPKLETVKVSHPTLSGETEYVKRILDTLASMLNRGSIDQRQYDAGRRYRDAWEMTTASMGGSMDFDRARGRGSAPVAPPLGYLVAAEDVHRAKFRLYPRMYALVHRVCVLGLTIEQAARQLYKSEREDGSWQHYVVASRALTKDGLGLLADEYGISGKVKIDPSTGREVRSMRSFVSERPTSTNADHVPQAKGVVHATRDKIFRSGGDQRKRGEPR